MLVTSLGMILVLGVNSSSMASVAARRMEGADEGVERLRVSDQTELLFGWTILYPKLRNYVKDSNIIFVSYLLAL